jgi:DNA polymerase III subunit delta'
MTYYYGHEDKLANLQTALQAGKLHHAWVLAGPKGLGKAHFAREAARVLVDPQNTHNSLVDNQTHPDIITIKRLSKDVAKDDDAKAATELKRNIAIDQIRSLQSKLTTRPGVAERRAIIIDSADDLERNGANALLKSLEEPPKDTYFFLVSHASERLLPTIRSRCQILRFDPLPVDQMDKAIRAALPDVPNDDLKAMMHAGAGSPGAALEFGGLELGEIENLMQKIVETGDANNKYRGQLADKLALKAAQMRYEAFLRRAPQAIAAAAQHKQVDALAATIIAYTEANALAGRAISLSLDKQSVVLQMAGLLASLYENKATQR